MVTWNRFYVATKEWIRDFVGGARWLGLDVKKHRKKHLGKIWNLDGLEHNSGNAKWPWVRNDGVEFPVKLCGDALHIANYFFPSLCSRVHCCFVSHSARILWDYVLWNPACWPSSSCCRHKFCQQFFLLYYGTGNDLYATVWLVYLRFMNHGNPAIFTNNVLCMLVKDFQGKICSYQNFFQR